MESITTPAGSAMRPHPLEIEAREISAMMYGVLHVFRSDDHHPCARLVELAETKFSEIGGFEIFRPDNQLKVYDVAALVTGASAQAGNEYGAELILAALYPKLHNFAQAMERPEGSGAGAPVAAAPVMRNTGIQHGGKLLSDVLRAATWDAASLCDHTLELISQLDVDTDTLAPCAVIKALVLRTKEINSLMMSFHDREELDLAHVYRKVYGHVIGERALKRDLSSKPSGTPLIENDEEAFGAGIRLFKAMLEDAKSREQDQSKNDASELMRWMRRGLALDAFAIDFLQQAVARPELLHGFAAALSCALTSGVVMHPNEFDVPLAEFRAGERGAEGTAPGDDGTEWLYSPVQPAPAKASAKRSVHAGAATLATA